MHASRMWGLILAGAVLLAPGLRAQGTPVLGHAGARAWAQALSNGWSELKFDERGHRLWNTRKFSTLSPAEQTRDLLERLKGDAAERRAALVLLGDRPLAEWAPQALDLREPSALAHNPKPFQRRTNRQTRAARTEIAHFLYLRGYRAPGADPYAYLDPADLQRPWTHGLGLHLEPASWRFQWLPSPALLPRLDLREPLPRALEAAPVPSALLHLKELRRGLGRLRALAGEGISGTLARGTRAGFLLRHVEAWFKDGAPLVDGLGNREAWILHYGTPQDSPPWNQDGLNPGTGTLVFLPGDLPARTRLALTFLKLNPTSAGARSRTLTWTARFGGGSAEITQVRGSGGVLHLASVPGGTWISDREAPLQALLFPAGHALLAERREWCRAAVAGRQPGTEASLWIIPRHAGGAAFERLAIRRRQLNALAPTWPNPFIAKAAPRTGGFAVALGAGPTEHLLAAFLRLDDPGEIPVPELPVFSDGGQKLTPAQKRDYLLEKQRAEDRRVEQKALRDQVRALEPFLDPRGAAFFGFGWTAAPPLGEADKARLAEYRRLLKEAPARAAKGREEGRYAFFGGFMEPGLSPSLALAVPLKEGKGPQVDGVMLKLFPRLFKGQAQGRDVAGVGLHRVRTAQAFTPTWAIVKDTLVLASDDRAAEQVVQGLQGQAPTLADLSSTAYGRAEMDGARLAGDLEHLLTAYLRANQASGRSWWMEPADPQMTQDEAAAEVAESFGPFLGAMRALGRVQLELTWGPGGLEARPK